LEIKGGSQEMAVVVRYRRKFDKKNSGEFLQGIGTKFV